MSNTDFLEYQRFINEELPKKLKEAAEIIGRLSKQIVEREKQVKIAELTRAAKERNWEITAYVSKENKNCVYKLNGYGYYSHPESISLTEKDIISDHIGFNIHTVRRLSDGCEFSVGEQTLYGTILGWEISKEMPIAILGEDCNLETNRASYRALLKRKQPLFRTEDGVEVFEGDSCVLVGDDWKIYRNDFCTKEFVDNFTQDGKFLKDGRCSIAFSTREKAEEYILWNKPCLSLKEIKKMAQVQNPYPFAGLLEKWTVTAKSLSELVKSKT